MLYFLELLLVIRKILVTWQEILVNASYEANKVTANCPSGKII